MGSPPLHQSGSRPRIAGWRRQGMLGLRYSFPRDPAQRWLADGIIDWLWGEAEKASVPIYMIATGSVAGIARIAERHPRLRLTIACSWRQCVTMFTEELSWLNEADKKLIMGEAACAWLGWQRENPGA
jgi:hypothetical protein